MFEGLARLARVRAGLRHLHGSVPTEVAGMDDPGVLHVVRRHPLGDMVGLYNVTSQWRPWPAYRLGTDHGIDIAQDAISGVVVLPSGDGNLWLPPYAAWWLTEAPAAPDLPAVPAVW